ncbi:unnamed protein product, partial [Prorocentrum cordatum]
SAGAAPPSRRCWSAFGARSTACCSRRSRSPAGRSARAPWHAASSACCARSGPRQGRLRARANPGA